MACFRHRRPEQSRRPAIDRYQRADFGAAWPAGALVILTIYVMTAKPFL